MGINTSLKKAAGRENKPQNNKVREAYKDRGIAQMKISITHRGDLKLKGKM